ncbi:MAG: translation elongation factor Ts, partial [Candidatus Falkowbacteria bacterium]|nr:translation elongation factor Ts [Candidatus Falkowbacteria bacterium]
ILELNSETDFVSRNEKFQTLADEILNLLKDKKPADLDELLSLTMPSGTVKENLDNLSGTVGEKMGIKRIAVVSGPTVAAYSHLGGRIGVLVVLDQADKTELAQEVAMQVAAANPKYLKPEEVSSVELDKEKEIYRAQLLEEGKPEAMVDKIVLGKVSKYYGEVCLLEQEFIKDDKKKVKDILAGVGVIQFIRYNL